ncbi:MAG: hypothetical protein AAB478_02770 [Patescibacteria group bacterium]
MERFRRLVTRRVPTVGEPPLSIAEVPPSVSATTAAQSETRASEVLDQERKQWEAAYIGRDFLGKREYLLSLALRDDPLKRIYAALGINDLGAEIDIPLTDLTPQEELARDAYLKATFFGEVDPDKYHEFATDSFTKDHLLALLNRNAAGVQPGDVTDWFHTTFGVTHLERYGSVYIGSHGGLGEYGYDHNATISPLKRDHDSRQRDETEEMSMGKAIDFAHVVRKSLPHIDMVPLAIPTYLQDAQDALQFLPRDWAA